MRYEHNPPHSKLYSRCGCLLCCGYQNQFPKYSINFLHPTNCCTPTHTERKMYCIPKWYFRNQMCPIVIPRLLDLIMLGVGKAEIQATGTMTLLSVPNKVTFALFQRQQNVYIVSAPIYTESFQSKRWPIITLSAASASREEWSDNNNMSWT